MRTPRALRDMNPIPLILVIGLVAAVVVPRVTGSGSPVPIKFAQGDVRTAIPEALEHYRRDMGDYPTTWEGLEALIQPPVKTHRMRARWNGPYLVRPAGTTDPWGSGYVYVYPGIKNTDAYDLASLGPDRRASRDDIRNW